MNIAAIALFVGLFVFGRQIIGWHDELGKVQMVLVASRTKRFNNLNMVNSFRDKKRMSVSWNHIESGMGVVRACRYGLPQAGLHLMLFMI